jgi:predicted transcriptional regulator
MRSQDVLLLSVRPRFARAILDGTKTVELRRRPVRAAPGTLLIIYASAPTMAVVGTARLGRVLVCEPDAAWQRHHPRLGLERMEFDEYLGGRLACLLLLEDVASLVEPLPLRGLQQEGPFRPPQSYRYVSPADPAAVRALVPSS